jgi:DNA-directed RNA polymerase subunit alpha
MAENEIKIAHPFEKCNFKLAFESESENYAKIVAEPLEKGFGITIGNALRRVLLSALPGTSVYAVEVEGAVHEFTALEGVEED